MRGEGGGTGGGAGGERGGREEIGMGVEEHEGEGRAYRKGW